MTVRTVTLLAMCLLLAAAHAPPMRAQDARSDMVVWTGIIPDGFPGNIYTWRLNADGTYEEDAVGASGKSAQPTFAGCWKTDGARMVLRQSKINYVFDGIVAGAHYAGTLYLEGRPFSRFCAAKGDQPPRACEPQLAIEATAPQVSCALPVADAGRIFE